MLPRAAGLILPLALLAVPPGAAQAALTCDKVPQLAAQFLRKHVQFQHQSDELVARTAEAYLERVDPSKTLLLEPEARAIRESFGKVFEGAQKGDCQGLLDLNARVVARYAELEAKVRKIVTADGFAIDPETQLVIDPDERGRPRTEAERDELLRRQIDFQLANYLSAGTPLPEARERLVHRYELFTLRARELDAEDLYVSFLDAFATSLDPHSNYLSSDALEDFQIAMTLSLEGIGVALTSRDGYSLVERVLAGGAADRAGVLRPGDRIIAVAQEEGPAVDIIDMALRDVVRLIRGPRGTPVRLTVLREGDSAERFQVTIVRDTIDLEEQAAKLRLETVPGAGRDLKLGVIELSSFYGDREPGKRQCADDVARLLAQARREKADGLVLDLSRNGGGLLDYAVEISGFFLRRGGIVAVRERGGPSQVLEDPDDELRWSGPLVVVLSRASASASEILAGALQDYGRAVVVGDDHSFGKGTVQTVVQLGPDLGALKVTTAMFYRPGGVSTQRSGVSSDVRIPSLLDSDRFGEATEPWALQPQRIRAFLSEQANAEDPGERWIPVTPELRERLRQLSRARVAESREFQAILAELAEAEASGGVVRVAEILGDKAPGPGSAEGRHASVGAVEGQLAAAPSAPATEGGGADGGPEEPTPQVEEAVRILADLIRLQGEASDG
jgi:carboxyl-terminal processing protease